MLANHHFPHEIATLEVSTFFRHSHILGFPMYHEPWFPCASSMISPVLRDLETGQHSNLCEYGIEWDATVTTKNASLIHLRLFIEELSMGFLESNGIIIHLMGCGLWKFNILL